MTYSRPLCRTEKVYLVLDEKRPGFANQFILEGTGVLDREKWQKAVETASEANPGSRLVLRGTWAFSRWVDSGITPRVREMDSNGWDGSGPERGPAFLNESLPAREGPTCEVILLHGDPHRIIFRTHHAVMDGRGTLHWIEDIIRALNGLPVNGSDSRITELEMCKSFQKKGRTPPAPEFIAPTGMPEPGKAGVTWQHIRIPGRYKNLMGQVAVLIARYTWKNGEGRVRFSIPVDLRPRKEGIRATGNLTNFIYLYPTPGTTPKDIRRDMAQQLEELKDGMLYWGDRLIPFMPMGMIRRSIDKQLSVRNTTGRYHTTAVISNMGYVPVEYMQGAGFFGNYGWAIPPCQELMPLFFGMGAVENGTILMVSIPNSLASGGRMDAFIDYIREGLVP
jgi:hypothetical protein